MEKLFEDTFTTEDENNTPNHNIGYGYARLYSEGVHDQRLDLDSDLANEIFDLIKRDLNAPVEGEPKVWNWYVYGETETTDATDTRVRPSIMIRLKENSFYVRTNMSDADFAYTLDDVLVFESRLSALLLSLPTS